MKYRAMMLAVLGVVFTAGMASAQTYPEIKLKQGALTPATVGPAAAMKFFADEVSKRSGGKISIEILWAGAGGAPAEMLKLVGGGALDVGAFPGSYFPAQMPFLASFSALPFVLPTSAKAQQIANALWEKVPVFQEEAKTNKLYPLYFQVLNEYHLLCTQPVRTLADLKNKKIRSQGEYIPLALRAIDAVPVTVLPGEFYEALQRGTVDCMLLPWDLIAANKLHEVAKYGSDISFGTLVGHANFYSAERWNSFSPEVKKLFTDVAKEAQVVDLKSIGEARTKALDLMKAGGMQLLEFQDKAAFKAKMPDFLAIWQKRMEEAGKGADAAKAVEVWKSVM